MTPQPLCPKSGAWRCAGNWRGSMMYQHELSGLCVSSAVETTDRGPEWHLSISVRGVRRPSLTEAAFALQAFGAENFEQDDHGTRITVNYWKPVNRDLEGECPCKVDEPVRPLEGAPL